VGAYVQVRDVNTPFLCQELRLIGFQVAHVAVVPDDAEVRWVGGSVRHYTHASPAHQLVAQRTWCVSGMSCHYQVLAALALEREVCQTEPGCCVLACVVHAQAIAEEVRRWSTRADVLLTCGGIGPTLDDVTMVRTFPGWQAQRGAHDARMPAFQLQVHPPVMIYLPSICACSLLSLSATWQAGIAKALDRPLVRQVPLLFEGLACLCFHHAARKHNVCGLCCTPRHSEFDARLRQMFGEQYGPAHGKLSEGPQGAMVLHEYKASGRPLNLTIQCARQCM
jgi:hypothetical protein